MSSFDRHIIEALAHFRLPDFSGEDINAVLRFFNTEDFAKGEAFVARYGAAINKESNGEVTLRPLNKKWLMGVAAYLRLERGSETLFFRVGPYDPPFDIEGR